MSIRTAEKKRKKKWKIASAQVSATLTSVRSFFFSTILHRKGRHRDKLHTHKPRKKSLTDFQNKKIFIWNSKKRVNRWTHHKMKG